MNPIDNSGGLYKQGSVPAFNDSFPRFLQTELGKISVAINRVSTRPAWRMIGQTEVTEPVNNVSFYGLDNFDELLLIGRNITLANAGTRNIRVSTDNGASWMQTNGDYLNVTSAGTEAPATGMPIQSEATTEPRSGVFMLHGLRSPFPTARIFNRSATAFMQPSSQINAIRLFAGSGGDITGGNVFLLGR